MLTTCSVVGVDPQRVAVERVPDVGDRRIDDVGGRHPLALDVDRRGIDARHVEDVLEQPGQPDQLGDRGAGLRPALVGRQLAAAGSRPRHGSPSAASSGRG